MLSDGAAIYTPGVSQRRSGATTFDLSDRLGTASKQTNSSATTSATRTYDAFGMLVASTGTPQGPFGFAGTSGYQEDGDTGLKLLGHRYYDSSSGRFLTRDPIKDGRNWYVYCDGNPLRRVDKTGLSWHDPAHVEVSKDFDGKVWVVGEPGPGKPQIIVPVKPGGKSPPNMDVDIVIVQHPDGTQERYFLPGTNGPQDPTRVDSVYDITSSGHPIAISPTSESIDLPTLDPGNPIISFPTRLPAFPPHRFGPTTGGYSPIFGGTGDWNKDIEAAKHQPGSHMK